MSEVPKIESGESLERPMLSEGPFTCWRGDEPSEFELSVAEQLSGLKSENNLYFVRLYTFQNSLVPLSKIIDRFLLEKAEFPGDRKVSFFHVSKEMKVKLPKPQLHFINEPNCIGSIHIGEEEYIFANQTLLLIACSQKDQDSKNGSLASTYDVFGYLTLMLGGNIFKKEIFSQYFCTTHKKFVSRELEFKSGDLTHNKIIGLKELYGFESFSAEDDKTHAALWFSGKAYSALDDASKVVYYKTALELAAHKKYQNFFGKIYKGRVYDLAIAKLNILKNMRDKLLHNGKPVLFPDNYERYLQVFILDALAYKQKGQLEKTGFEYLCSLEQTNP